MSARRSEGAAVILDRKASMAEAGVNFQDNAGPAGGQCSPAAIGTGRKRWARAGEAVRRRNA